MVNLYLGNSVIHQTRLQSEMEDYLDANPTLIWDQVEADEDSVDL